MTSIAVLTTDNPNPEDAQIPVKCVDCVHFRRVPNFSIGGKLVTCESSAIGRLPNQTPCNAFALDTYVFVDSAPETLAVALHLQELLSTERLDRGKTEAPARPNKSRAQANTKNLILGLTSILNALKAGYRIGQPYSAELPSGQTVTGLLLAISGNRKQAILLHDGQRVRVASEDLTEAPSLTAVA